MKKSTQQILVFVFGVIFLVVLLILAWTTKNPTSMQILVFRVVLALAAAGFAAMLPGFISANIPPGIKAGGALAVLVIVFFFDPGMKLNRVLVSPGDATVTADAGTYDAAELVDILARSTGRMVVDEALHRQLEGKKVKLPGALKDVKLKVALDQVFQQAGVPVIDHNDGGTLVLKAKEGDR
jgi:hypothetical protein